MKVGYGLEFEANELKIYVNEENNVVATIHSYCMAWSNHMIWKALLKISHGLIGVLVIMLHLLLDIGKYCLWWH
ncbi:unnamed protein product [Brassica oleracea var. botrytis]